MTKSADRLNEARERIAAKLHELTEEEERLTRKKRGLEALEGHLRALLERAEKADSDETLEEIIRIGELKVELRPNMPKFSKYAVTEALNQKLTEAEDELSKILHDIEVTKSDKANADLCPNCGGEGRLKEVQYLREEKPFRPVMRVIECDLCGGKGRISLNLPEPLRRQVQ